MKTMIDELFEDIAQEIKNLRKFGLCDMGIGWDAYCPYFIYQGCPRSCPYAVKKTIELQYGVELP